MDYEERELLAQARPETRPFIPKKVWWKSKILGKQKIEDYLWNYYQRESEHRVPFYLPSIFMKECMDYLCRYGKIPKSQLVAVLIDGEDYRIDYFLSNYLEHFQYLTIVTDRKEYFESLQERAFQELGLLIDLVHTWEEKQLQGNLVWDFSEKLQKKDCYPAGSICFMPCKKEWKQEEMQKCLSNVLVISLKSIRIRGIEILPQFAECMIVPKGVTFRGSRCEMLEKWCKKQGWNIKMKVCKASKTLTN